MSFRHPGESNQQGFQEYGFAFLPFANKQCFLKAREYYLAACEPPHSQSHPVFFSVASSPL